MDSLSVLTHENVAWRTSACTAHPRSRLLPRLRVLPSELRLLALPTSRQPVRGSAGRVLGWPSDQWNAAAPARRWLPPCVVTRARLRAQAQRQVCGGLSCAAPGCVCGGPGDHRGVAAVARRGRQHNLPKQVPCTLNRTSSCACCGTAFQGLLRLPRTFWHAFLGRTVSD